jgi:hypothetical protein
MKYLFLFIALLINNSIFAQDVETKTFISGTDTITYKSIEAPYNPAYIYINIYEANEALTTKALGCLQRGAHNSFYFLELPGKYSQEQRELILNDLIIKVIREKENIKKAVFYFNFDANYAPYYNNNTSKKKPKNKIVRTITDITAENICRFIKR